jgi:hypothetical protein
MGLSLKNGLAPGNAAIGQCFATCGHAKCDAVTSGWQFDDNFVMKKIHAVSSNAL